jgi:hypothetical protein
MDAFLVVMAASWFLDVLAFGIKAVWVMVTIVSVISLIVVISHLVPRKEY